MDVKGEAYCTPRPKRCGRGLQYVCMYVSEDPDTRAIREVGFTAQLNKCCTFSTCFNLTSIIFEFPHIRGGLGPNYRESIALKNGRDVEQTIKKIAHLLVFVCALQSKH